MSHHLEAKEPYRGCVYTENLFQLKGLSPALLIESVTMKRVNLIISLEIHVRLILIGSRTNLYQFVKIPTTHVVLLLHIKPLYS